MRLLTERLELVEGARLRRPEMAELQAEFNRLLGVREPEKIQMAIRVGRAERAYAAPRRDPHEFLADAPPAR